MTIKIDNENEIVRHVVTGCVSGLVSIDSTPTYAHHEHTHYHLSHYLWTYVG